MQRNSEVWITHRVRGKQITETPCEKAQMSELTDKNFLAAILDVFKELKEEKEGLMTEFHQIEKIKINYFLKFDL